MEVERVTGEALLDALAEVARLRIAVFREYPYLYDGDEEAEEAYLRHYARAAGAVLVLARSEDGKVVGASTAMPLSEADPCFQKPFREAGEEVADWFYFGESVLKAEYRGRGVGHRFFDERELHAGDLGYRRMAFCAVVRPEGHPLKPVAYRPHNAFWTRRGFTMRPAWRAKLAWAQIDSAGREVDNELVFWTKLVGDEGQM